MTPTTKKTTKTVVEEGIHIQALGRSSITVRIVGVTPLFQNRMTAKAMQQLLVGGSKKGARDRIEIKHQPLEEFRDSVEQLADGPTALGLRVICVKAAMCNAALETPGLTKTAAQRLIFMPGDFVPLYGTPQLRMDVTRQANINRTPDVRTRAYLPKWGAEVDVQYITPQLGGQAIMTLLYNAGQLMGLGDYRQEKGKGSYGTFRIIPPDKQDDEWDDLVANHGRAVQEKALADPVLADKDTADLMEFFYAERKRRAA